MRDPIESLTETTANFINVRAGSQPDGFDPYPIYRQLRDAAPVWQSQWGDWYVSSFAAVAKAMTEPSFRRSPLEGESETAGGMTGLAEKLAKYLREWLLFSDPPSHTRLRRAMLGVFQANDAATLSPEIAALCRSLQENASNNRANVVETLTRPLPINIISGILGVPKADRHQLVEWARIVREILDSGVDDGNNLEAAATIANIQDYFLNLVRDEAWVRKQGADRFAPLVKGFPIETVATNLSMLALAGHETTVHLVGSMLLHLGLRPELWRRLRSHRDLVPGVVAETLRFESPVQKVCRWSPGGLQLDGVQVSEGALLVLLIGAAHRDPAQFRDPDSFDPNREGGIHLAFGRGAHLCVGRPLALVEAETVLHTLLDCWQEFEIGPDGWRWYNNSSLRGLSELDLAWRPAAGVG